MKKIASEGRLQLHKETLRSLSAAQLGQVGGASVPLCADTIGGGASAGVNQQCTIVPSPFQAERGNSTSVYPRP